MNQEILNRLDALAAKLGIASSHLWEVLVRQGQVELVQHLTAFAIFFVFTIMSFFWLRYCLRQDDYDWTFWGWASSVFIWVCFFISFGITTGTITQYLISPEYYAFREIGKILK